MANKRGGGGSGGPTAFYLAKRLGEGEVGVGDSSLLLAEGSLQHLQD